MNYEQMSNNKLSITGKILEVPVFSHEVFGEGFYETKIEVKRLSEQVDILPITISERLIIEHDIKVGDVISVSGQFRSYNKMVDDKSRLMLTIFVREILDEEICKNRLSGHRIHGSGTVETSGSTPCRNLGCLCTHQRQRGCGAFSACAF